MVLKAARAMDVLGNREARVWVSMVKAMVPSPRSMFAGSLSETVQWPLSSSAQGAFATSTPSTRATAVIFAPFGTPPSLRMVSSVAVSVSPWP